MTNYTPLQVALKGGNDLGGTHCPKAELGWSGFEPAEGDSRVEDSINILSTGTREMGELAAEFESNHEVGGPLDPMHAADIRPGFQEESAPELFGGMTRVPLPSLSQETKGHVVFIQRPGPDGRGRGRGF